MIAASHWDVYISQYTWLNAVNERQRLWRLVRVSITYSRCSAHSSFWQGNFVVFRVMKRTTFARNIGPPLLVLLVPLAARFQQILGEFSVGFTISYWLFKTPIAKRSCLRWGSCFRAVVVCRASSSEFVFCHDIHLCIVSVCLYSLCVV